MLLIYFFGTVLLLYWFAMAVLKGACSLVSKWIKSHSKWDR